MFLAVLAFNTVEAEIKDLENKENRRKSTLEQSKKDLESDHLELMKFITDDNNKKKETQSREKKMIAERQDKEDTIKKLDGEIQAVKSEIEKNKDNLDGLKRYQDFLIKLSDEKFKQQREENMAYKREQVKRDWIRKMQMKANDDNLDTIFRYDEEIHGTNPALQHFFATKLTPGAGD